VSHPALQRLELNGWIDGFWGVTSNIRRARIYKITATGRRQLAVETRKYAKLTLAIARVMGAE
jgi:PadR family transcriptional regulator